MNRKEWQDAPYLNHLSSLELLDVAELAGLADHFATLQIDDALQRRKYVTNKPKCCC